MDFGPHSSFVPHSPLSYSNSYSPASPLKEQNNNNANEECGNRQGGQTVDASQPNKSILKNSATAYLKEQHKSRPDLTRKQVIPNPPMGTRKETLKTVAFGLTTRLEDTVLAKEGKQSGTNRTNKTIIFSHEAQSLHKLIVEQQDEITGLRKTVDELIEADDRHRSEAREQMNIIADLSTRLMDVEKRLAGTNSSSKGGLREESKMKEKEAEPEHVPQLMEKPRDNQSSLKQSNARKTLFRQQQNIQREDQQRNAHKMQHQQQLSTIMSEEVSPSSSSGNRNEILQRLDQQMQINPYFENRIKSMLRVWTDDMSSPTVEPNRDESIGGVPSMLVRVTTQRQELFYSTSPGRSRRGQQQIPPFPRGQENVPQRRNHRHQCRPIVTEITEGGEDNEPFETVPNIRRSDHCTDDAEFFQPNNNNIGEIDGDDQEVEEYYADENNAHNCTNNQQPFRRRKREATSAIRNKYK